MLRENNENHFDAKDNKEIHRMTRLRRAKAKITMTVELNHCKVLGKQWKSQRGGVMENRENSNH